MEPEEIDIALEELEVRLERLRALYEQYFLGIEKLEPQIPRKDVDRRIYVLRREKVRNTGKRFKLQTLIQRYNTFQQYWQRICREIENGTYKRHLIRAEKTVGPTALLTVAARRRFGKERERRESDQPQTEAATQSRSSFPATAAPGSISSLPPDSSAMPTLPPGPRRTPTLRGISSPPPPGAETPISLRPPPPASPIPTPPPRQFAEPAKPPAARPSVRPSASKPPAAFESLELDMDFMGDWDPGKAARERAQQAPRPRAGTGAQPPEQRAAPAEHAAERAQRVIAEFERAAAAAAAKPEAQGARRLAPPPKPTRQTLESQPEAPPKPAPANEAKADLRPEPPPPARAKLESQPEAPKPARPKFESEPEAPKPARPKLESQPEAAARPPAPLPPSQPDAAPEPAAAAQSRERVERPARPAAREAALAREPAPTVSDQRLHEVHKSLVEASRSAGGPSVSYEGLAKSLRAVEAKLRAQHGNNRRVDFEVVFKDGKPVVKPVVR